jgi:hypothetical protein
MVMEEMEKNHCWLSSMTVKGSQRISRTHAGSYGYYASSKIIKTSPGWAEITYLRKTTNLSCRQLLLLFVFAQIEKQLGFALEVAELGMTLYKEPIFNACRESTTRKISQRKMKLPLLLAKRKLIRILGGMNA